MADVSRNEIESAPVPTPVSWSSCVYTLFALGAVIMTQPVGSVLMNNSTSRIYLRCSPIFCLGDTIEFLSHILRRWVFHTYSFREAVRCTVEERYALVPDGAESLSSMNGGATLRWFATILGTHGAILKLAGAEGIPWTQFWGFCYVVSFVVFEIMVLVIPKERERYPPRAPHRQIFQRRSFTDCTGIGVCIYMTVRVIIWSGTAPLLWFALGALEWNHNPYTPPGYPPGFFTTGIAFWLWLPSTYISAFIVMLGFRPFRKLIDRHPTFAERLLLLSKADADLIRDRKVDYDTDMNVWRFSGNIDRDRLEITLWPLYFFMAHFSLGVLWYRIAYDPKGTKSADWANVLG